MLNVIKHFALIQKGFNVNNSHNLSETLPIQNAQEVEEITVLQAKQSRVLTKTFGPEGVKPYDSAKFFEVKTFKASNIQDLSVALTKLELKPRCCIIRGAFKGAAFAQTIEGMVDGPNMFARKKVLFDDAPKHFLMIDVDSYEPAGINPIHEPVKAVEAYIKTYLPPCFHGVHYHWQLSASAGSPGKEHILKAHIWFWLKTPYTSPQLTAWAKSVSKAIDVAPLRVVQAHYTANPIYKEGMKDPVPVRSGLEEGWDGDTVDLVIDPAVLLRAGEYAGEAEDYEFLDPSEKPGVIGAFHRAYSVEEVLEEFLADEFVIEPGQDRRVTWLNGGGTPGGCFITDDRLHFGSTHNTDPFDNRIVNLFDLVRHYLFGNLDQGMDAFELLDMTSRPSYIATINMLRDLPEVKEELAKEKIEDQTTAVSIRDRLSARIRSAVSEAELRTDVCLEVQRNYKDIYKADVTLLANEVKRKFADLNLGGIGINDARALLAPPRRELQHRNGGLPDWAQPYVYVTNRAQIYRYDSNEWLSREAFDFKHNPDAGFDGDGNQMSAYAMLRDSRGVTRVEQGVYMPQMPATFTLDGVVCVNTYRPSSVPNGKPEVNWTDADREAVRLASRHIDLICGNRAEVVLGLMDWLSFCVQYPGVKINYTWLIVGGEGVGKTWIGQMMAVAMGRPNVRVVSVE